MDIISLKTKIHEALHHQFYREKKWSKFLSLQREPETAERFGVVDCWKPWSRWSQKDQPKDAAKSLPNQLEAKTFWFRMSFKSLKVQNRLNMSVFKQQPKYILWDGRVCGVQDPTVWQSLDQWYPKSSWFELHYIRSRWWLRHNNMFRNRLS